MQFNSDTTGQDICTLANRFTKQNDTTYPLTEKVSDANMANRLILTEIHNAYGGWKYDDRNNTDFPIATTDVTAGQTDYALPIDTQNLNGVYFLTPNTTDNWTKLKPLTLEEINNVDAEPDFNNTPSTPRFYRALSNSIIIYPACNENINDGLMVEYSRDVSTFATTDTTKEPAFDSTFHESIPTYMAYIQAKINQSPTKKDFQADWFDYLARIRRHYVQKFKDMYPPRIKINNTINEYL
jgi:hypothetical protein